MKTDDLPLDAAPIAFTLNRRALEAAPGESILKAAQRAGARARWPVSVRPRARTKRPTCSRS